MHARSNFLFFYSVYKTKTKIIKSNNQYIIHNTINIRLRNQLYYIYWISIYYSLWWTVGDLLEKQYVCRKTLADSRPRIRGRFARNDEIEKAPQNEWHHLHMAGDHQGLEYYDENWISFLDSISANLIP